MHAKVRILPPQPILEDKLLNNKKVKVLGVMLIKILQKKLPLKSLILGKASVGSFSDGETMVELLENVRGKDVFIIQSISSPANDNLMEIMVMVDALRRSSAARITAAISLPCF